MHVRVDVCFLCDILCHIASMTVLSLCIALPLVIGSRKFAKDTFNLSLIRKTELVSLNISRHKTHVHVGA